MHSLLQSKMWAEFKGRHQWHPHTIVVEIDHKKHSVYVLERELAFGKTMLYAPEVSLEKFNKTVLSQINQQVQKLSNSAIFFRLELLKELGQSGSSSVAILKNSGYRKAFEEVQPEHRQWIDIGGDELTILSSMKEKGRYNTRLATKKGVTTRISTDTSDVEVFYKIFQDTATRDGFQIRSQSYFEDLCQMLFEHKAGELVIAEYEGEPLAALIITYFDGMASYLYGASSNVQRNLMAPYAAHWTAIQSAKKHGCTIYDLLQIAPGEANENHKYSALSRFKQQFGGRSVELLGGWDLVLMPAWYQGFKIAEKLRRH